MLQLFQTRDGPFFFIDTLVYTCRAFFAVSSKNIYPIYCFGHSSSLSVVSDQEWAIFFFHRHTCRAFLLLYHQKIFIPYIVLVTVRLSLFRNEILFLL